MWNTVVRTKKYFAASQQSCNFLFRAMNIVSGVR